MTLPFRTLAVLASSLALVAGAASAALADTEQEINKTVSQLALSSNSAEFGLSAAGPSGSCDGSLIRFDASTPVGRMWYATLLEAISSGASVDVIFERDSNQCRVLQVLIR